MPRPVMLALALLVAAPLGAAAAVPAPKPAAAPGPAIRAAAKPITLADGLVYTDVVIGRGASLQPGRTAIVHYVGTLSDGKKFDSSRDRNEPYPFVLGGHGVIACWEEGVATMRVGGRRKLVCPPALAFGDRGAGGVIPPNATLYFDVELLAIQ